MTQVRVMVVDDHAVVRVGLKALINAEPDMEVVGEFSDGFTAMPMIEELDPDVIVLGISTRELDGADLAAQLRDRCPERKALVLTVHEDKSCMRMLLEAGAAGYVLKRAAVQDLVHAIRVVASGGVYLDPTMAGSVIDDLVRPQASADSSAAELSDRESEVVRLIALGYSNKEIAALLELSVKTIETYKARSMEKLGMRSRVDIVQYALKRGWLSPAIVSAGVPVAQMRSGGSAVV